MSAHSKRRRRITALSAAAIVAVGAAAAACGSSSHRGGAGPAGWVAVDYTLGQPFSLGDAQFYQSFSGDASGQPPFEYRPEIPFGSCGAYPPIGSPSIALSSAGRY